MAIHNIYKYIFALCGAILTIVQIMLFNTAVDEQMIHLINLLCSKNSTYVLFIGNATFISVSMAYFTLFHPEKIVCFFLWGDSAMSSHKIVQHVFRLFWLLFWWCIFGCGVGGLMALPICLFFETEYIFLKFVFGMSVVFFAPGCLFFFIRNRSSK